MQYIVTRWLDNPATATQQATITVTRSITQNLLDKFSQ